jgi:phage major head subunit gpT-like protein
MASVTPSNFAVFITNVNTMIGEVYSTTSPVYPAFTTTIPVSSHFLEFGWAGMLPKMRVWNGPRYTSEPNPQTCTYEVLPYELTIAIDRFRLDDDQFGIYYRTLPDMARQTKRWPDYEIRDLLENTGAYTGYRQNGLDGMTAFNTAHPINFYNVSQGTYCNDFTGGGQNVTYTKPGGGTVTTLVGGAFGPTAFATLIEYQTTIQAEDGEAWGITPTHLMHSPQLRLEVELVLKSMFFAPPSWGTISGQVGAADNPLKRFGMTPLENPLLKNAYTWYSFDCSKAFKPILWGLRDAPMLVPRVNENDPTVYDQHTYQWGAWGRATAAWSFSQTFARSGP